MDEILEAYAEWGFGGDLDQVSGDDFDIACFRWLLAEARWWAGELRFQHVEMLDREPFPWEVM